jgi:hypothetical protein
MAFPKWLTPEGNLGVVPELAYYQFPLDAYDENLFAFYGNITANSKIISHVSNLSSLVKGQAITGLGIPTGSIIVDTAIWSNLNISGNTITISANATATTGDLPIKSIPIEYSRVSGVLPTGLQITPSGKLVGIPESTPYVGADKNQTYTFSIRATNIYTGNITDRTFNLTITNVAPPIITPKTVVIINQLALVGNISANIGDYLTQAASGANAQILTGVIDSSTISVSYVSGSPSYVFGSGNLRVVSGNVSLYPNKSVNAYPLSTTIVSTLNSRDLGLYFDGAVVDLQLEAIEFANSAILTWTVTTGALPDGLTLSSNGLISGYIKPIPSIGPSSNPGWDETPWDLDPDLSGTAYAPYGWDFPLGTTSKNFSWTVEVSDGVNYDMVTYTMLVYPRHYFTADSTLIKVTDTVANTVKLTVDTGSRHYPIILSTQADIPAERENGNFSFHIQAVDLDDDVLQYTVPALSTGAYDEQVFIGNSVPYITATLDNGNLYTGVFPKTTIISLSSIGLFLGNTITANVGDIIRQPSTGANATVTSNVVNGSTVSVTITSGTFTTAQGNLQLNGNALIKSVYSGGWSNIGVVPSAIVTSPGITVDNTSPELLPGDQIQFLQFDAVTPNDLWYLGTVNNNTTIRLTGNAIVAPTVGYWMTQGISGANATVTNVSPTTGTISLGGNTLIGTLTVTGNIITANVGDIITQDVSGANATITANVVQAVVLPVRFNGNTFTIGSGNIRLKGANASAYPTSITSSAQPVTFTANVGDVITQNGSTGNAVVSANVPGATSVIVTFNSGTFNLNSGNLKINGANVNVYPTSISTQTDIGAIYNTGSVFKFNTVSVDSYVKFNTANTYATPTKVVSVGVTSGSSSAQGDVGFDEGKYDQGVLTLPQGLVIDKDSGWLTGSLPGQTVNEVTYIFSIVVYKRDYPGYSTNQQFTLTVLGDLNNLIDWVTPSYLGTLENGAISDLFVHAVSRKGKTLYYEYAADSHIRLPQGLELLSSGIISGRVSFEVFSLDQGETTIDGNRSTFDNTYEFSVTARDFDNTIEETRSFTIKVLQRNRIPYENLYLKALLSRAQRIEFQNILQDKTVFPLNLIYRNEDPFYGLSIDIKTLFLAGLNPSLLSQYAAAVSTNHFTKRVNFGQIKTAVATDGGYNVIETATGINIGVFKDNVGFIPNDEYFNNPYATADSIPAGTQLGTEHIKYEVVYAEVSDDNTNSLGQGPAAATADAIDLTGIIANPYYDLANVAYYTAYPNSFENMSNVVVQGSHAIGYVNQGALPDWMTSKQPDGRVLGFTRAVVLAYTIEGASDTIAYRFNQAEYNLNELDFTVDRYQLDNNYTANYDITANAFIHSKETTFDKYPGLSSIFTTKGVVDYAVTISFEQINDRSITSIRQDGGLDGINSFNDGEYLVFFNQEFETGSTIGDTYNLGWSNVYCTWGAEPWDYDETTVSPTDDLPWDAANYIPGYNEHLLNPSIPDERIGIWQINIDANSIVRLNFVSSVGYYDKIYVRNGFTHGATNIYYDPIVKTGKNIPNYSIIPQQIRVVTTRFDGNGTKFLDYRDTYSVPEQGDKYIKFAKNGVFT